MKANADMPVCHWLHAANAGKDRNGSKFALLVGQQAAFENVTEKMLFQKFFNGRGK